MTQRARGVLGFFPNEGPPPLWDDGDMMTLPTGARVDQSRVVFRRDSRRAWVRVEVWQKLESGMTVTYDTLSLADVRCLASWIIR